MRNLASLLAAAVAMGCGNSELINYVGPPDGSPEPEPGMDAGEALDACGEPLRSQLTGLTSPWFQARSSDQAKDEADPDRIALSGDLLSVKAPGMRTYLTTVCAGPTKIAAYRARTQEFMGSAEWNAASPLPSIPDCAPCLAGKGSCTQCISSADGLPQYPDVVLYAFGREKAYEVKALRPNYGPAASGRENWILHIANALYEPITVRYRLVDPWTTEVIPEDEGGYSIPVVTDLAPHDTAIVEVNQPKRHDVNVMADYLSLEVSPSIDRDATYLLHLWSPGMCGRNMELKTPDGPEACPPPAGSVFLIDVGPMTGGVNYWYPYHSFMWAFVCRDPLWLQLVSFASGKDPVKDLGCPPEWISELY